MKKAKSRAELEKLDIEWVQEDMRSFVRPNEFDLAISLFTSFGYFGDEENLKVLRNAFRSLAPGGFFIIDVMGKEITARGFAASSVNKHPDGSIWVQSREVIDDWYRIRTRWFLIRDQKVIEVSFDTALYSGRELADLLKRAGFEQVKLFGSLQGIPYDLKAQRLVAVAQKQQASATGNERDQPSPAFSALPAPARCSRPRYYRGDPPKHATSAASCLARGLQRLYRFHHRLRRHIPLEP